jgi:predicted nucleic acid-binding protein
VNLLLDADAFICLRKRSLLELLRAAPGVSLVSTQYIARHELNPLQREIAQLEKCGILTVPAVAVRTPAHGVFRALQKEGADKGEAEAIAWATSECPVDITAFVTLDKGARKLSEAKGLAAVDVFDLAVLLVQGEVLKIDDVRAKLSTWDDRADSFGRPADYTTFDDTWKRRIATRRPSEG